LDDLIETAGPTSVGTRQAGTAIIGDDFYIVGGNSETAGDTDAVWRVVISGVTAGAAISETTLPADDFVYISDSTANTDTHLYVAGGGWNSSVPTLWDRAHSIEVLPDGSLDGGGWVASAVFPNGYVHQLGGAVIPDNGFLYVFGGQDDNTATFYDDCYYAEIMGDGSLGPWQTGSDLPQATWFTGSTSIGNSIIVAAGTTTGSGAGALDEVWVCDVNPDGTMGSWTVQTETLPAARYGAKLVAVGDDVLAIGGRDTAGGSSSQDNVWRAPFDSGTSTVGAWTTVDAQLPFGVHYHDAVYSPDEERIYILAGQSGGTAHTNQLISSSHLFAGAVTAVQDWSLFE
jgi:hypothetical protein